jgi:hypothetical protein
MIVEWMCGRPLADKDALAALYEVSPRTVRRYCRPVAYHPTNGAALYDALHAAEALAQIRARPRD